LEKRLTLQFVIETTEMILIEKRLFLFTILFVAGCSHLDRIACTSLAPTHIKNGCQHFKYKAFADTVYPLDSEKAEATRIKWLEKWLADNGYPNPEYEIISRQPILRNKGLLGGVYDIYYDVKVNQDKNKQ